MSSQTVVLNLLSYSLQVGVLLGAGLLLPSLLRLEEPRVALRYWQVLLASALLLPALQPWKAAGTGTVAAAFVWSGEIAVTAAGEPGIAPALSDLLLLAVCLGTLGRLLWLAVGLRALSSMTREAALLDPLPPAVAELERRLVTAARFLLSDRVAVPATFGSRRPVILLPAAFAAMPTDRQVGIACHELLHVSRRDWLAALAEEGVRALLWFHPAVWLVLARLSLAREQVVDQEVVRVTGARRPYLEALASIARQRHQPAAFIPGLLFLNRSHLVQRVALLSKEVSMSRSRLIATVAAMAGLLLLTGLLATATFPLLATAEAAAEGSSAERVVLRLDASITMPKLVHRVRPIYPDELREERIQGMVKVEIVIDEHGKVAETKVLSSSHESLGTAAVEAIGQWRFEPARRGGEPVAVFYVLTVDFRLDD